MTDRQTHKNTVTRRPKRTQRLTSETDSTKASCGPVDTPTHGLPPPASSDGHRPDDILSGGGFSKEIHDSHA